MKRVANSSQLHKAIGYALIMPFFFIAIFMHSCTNQLTSSLVESTITLPKGNETIYQLDKHYLILYPGDTAFLSGTSTSTIITNGVVTSTKTDSLYLRTITHQATFLNVNGTRIPVFPQVFQMGRSVDSLCKDTIVRYFQKTDTALLQIAYLKNKSLSFLLPDHRKVAPTTIEVGSFNKIESAKNRWTASPLMPLPFSDSVSTISICGFSVAFRGLAMQNGEIYVVNGFRYTEGISIRHYLTIGGSETESGKTVRINGSVMITYNYFAARGLLEIISTSSVQKIFDDGTIQITNQDFYLGRPAFANAFPDNQIP